MKSDLTTPFLPITSAVVPEFAFLDGSYRVIDTRPAGDFEVFHELWRSGVTGRVNGAAGRGSKPRRARLSPMRVSGGRHHA